MWWLFTNKARKHSTIQADETVYQACYGLGGSIVQAANQSISQVNETWAVPETGEGLASPLNRSGVVVLTNQRLLFFAKRFALGRLGDLTAEWPIQSVRTIKFVDETLTIEFVDESAAQLHVPQNQSPDKLVAALQSVERNSMA